MTQAKTKSGKASRAATSGSFQPGDKRAGRPPGVPNKVTTALKDMILQALDGAGGVEYLKVQAVSNPNAFLSLVGRVLPLQVTDGEGKPVVPATLTFVFAQQPDSENRS